MFPDFRSHASLSIRHQQGIGLPIALFVITVLALLVTGMAQLQQATARSVSLQIQSQRAFHAAESGAQLAVAEVLDGADCATVTTSVDFSAGGLKECGAEIQCSVTAPLSIPGGGGNRVYTLVSSGECGSGNELARRAVEVRLR
ncbi:hypothetical protein MD273_16745 [Marinobacter pelagius]|uniref:pilus assembly PilX family protein n=1 Tax=Marinobacter sp. C7 TaxID=2951363 RepID=UPI001EF011AC|nr:hypothetical protein [Marinobacter sp. C7]MCG7201387.1 hypothetical protein [Marinobacter sp. C7]